MKTTKQRAFQEWLNNCPVDFKFNVYEERKTSDSLVNEVYVFFVDIPTVELVDDEPLLDYL